MTTDKSLNKVIQFPKAALPSLIVETYEGNEATVRLQYEHLVNAVAIYLQTLPFGLDNRRDILDVDLGLSVDADGYVTMDIVFDKD